MRRIPHALVWSVVLPTAAPALAVSVDGLRYVDRYTLPYTPGLNGSTFGDTLFGGISGLDRDPTTGHYIAISDDRSQNAPAGGNPAARFYDISINVGAGGFVGPNPVTINAVQTLKRPDGTTFPALGVDPESIRVRSTGSGTTLLWTSEGAVSSTANPPLQNTFVREMNLDGTHLREFSTPAKMTPDAVSGQTTGIRNNLAFESVTLSTDGTKVYAATESSLFQDGPRATTTAGSANRIVEFDTTTGNALREFVYPTDPIQAANSANANDNGLAEMLAIDDGTFLAVERSFALNEGNNIRVYKVALAGATDVSGLNSLVGQSYTPVSKQLLLTLPQPALGGAFNPDNIEAIAPGPTLPGGEASFILAVDNNFSSGQVTQFVMVAVPEPTTVAAGALVLAFLTGRRRRQAMN